jgi:hypothetical protein
MGRHSARLHTVCICIGTHVAAILPARRLGTVDAASHTYHRRLPAAAGDPSNDEPRSIDGVDGGARALDGAQTRQRADKSARR